MSKIIRIILFYHPTRGYKCLGGALKILLLKYSPELVFYDRFSGVRH
jgi:hypothetical protein